MKTLLKIVLGLFIWMLFFMFWGSRDRRASVKEMCQIKAGSTLEEVTREGSRLKLKGPLKTEGEIAYWNVIVKPFGRLFCAIEIKDGKVVSTKLQGVD